MNKKEIAASKGYDKFLGLNLDGEIFDVQYCSPQVYYFWELEYIPESAGIYVIYDKAGNCLYVGSTPHRFNLNERIKEHLSKALFNNYGYKIVYFETKEDTVDILLLERAFIKKYQPIFNNDENEKEMSKKAVTYLEEYGETMHYSMWNNPVEKAARLAEVPTNIVVLREVFHDEYQGTLSQIKMLVKGKISLPTLYAKLKEIHQMLLMTNATNWSFNDFIKATEGALKTKFYSFEDIEYMIFMNKSLNPKLVKKYKDNLNKFLSSN